MKIKARVMLPSSKWSKHQIVAQVEAFREYLPDTELYSEVKLLAFLKKYSSVYIKPTNGYGGLNIFRVDHGPDGIYQVTMENIRRTLTSPRMIHQWVRERGRLQNKKHFLVQKGIDLAQCNGRQVDMRVVVQRNESKRWEVTGLSAKVAGDQLAVTNVSRGGRVMEVEKCLEAIGFSKEDNERLITDMGILALRISQYLDQRYDNKIYGFDIGVDKQGRLWLIEINTRPSLVLFPNQPNHPMNRRISQLSKWNQRNR